MGEIAKDSRWVRQTKTCTLNSLFLLEGHRYTAKELWMVWLAMPLVQYGTNRGVVTASKKASLQIFMAGRKALFDAMKDHGVPYPTNSTERGLVMRCLGAMVTRKHFGTAVPPAIKNMPIQPGRDDKDAMWRRLNCQARI